MRLKTTLHKFILLFIFAVLLFLGGRGISAQQEDSSVQIDTSVLDQLGQFEDFSRQAPTNDTPPALIPPGGRDSFQRIELPTVPESNNHSYGGHVIGSQPLPQQPGQRKLSPIPGDANVGHPQNFITFDPEPIPSLIPPEEETEYLPEIDVEPAPAVPPRMGNTNKLEQFPVKYKLQVNEPDFQGYLPEAVLTSGDDFVVASPPPPAKKPVLPKHMIPIPATKPFVASKPDDLMANNTDISIEPIVEEIVDTASKTDAVTEPEIQNELTPIPVPQQMPVEIKAEKLIAPLEEAQEITPVEQEDKASSHNTPKMPDTDLLLKTEEKPINKTIHDASGRDHKVEIIFPVGVTDISPQMKEQLQKDVVEFMQQNPSWRVQIQAFASNTDKSASSARRISLSRSLAIRSYLIDQKLEPHKIDVRALGSETDANPLDRVDLIFFNTEKRR